MVKIIVEDLDEAEIKELLDLLINSNNEGKLSLNGENLSYQLEQTSKKRFVISVDKELLNACINLFARNITEHSDLSDK